MSAASKGNGNSGCGTVVVGFVVIALALAILKTIWWLLLILAIVAAAGAVLYRKKASEKPPAESGEDEPSYTQKCPNCGGQITVSVYDSIANCSYCGSSFAAEHEPMSRIKQDEGKGFLADPFKALIVLSVVLAVLGLVGLGYSLYSDDSSTASQQTSSQTQTSGTEQSSPAQIPDAASDDAQNASDDNGQATQSDAAASNSANSEDAQADAKPVELNTLQKVFCSLGSTKTIGDIDSAIEDNGFSVSKFGMHDDSSYYIGYEYQAVAKRSRDRQGEAIDVSFDDDGAVTKASYSLHVESGTQGVPEYKNGKFYYEDRECQDGETAMQLYLSDHGA